jgi:hypothetical protein
LRFWVRLTGIEDDLVVGSELGGNGLPPGLEVVGRGDDTARAIQEVNIKARSG